MKNYYKEFTKEKWELIKTHPYYSKRVENIIATADKYLSAPPLELISFSDINAYYVTGSRSPHQEKHGAYSARLRAYFLAYMLTEDEKYISPISDTIWAMCDLAIWALPAHIISVYKENPGHALIFIDLVASGWGRAISEVLNYIGDKLPSFVRYRAEAELRRRIIDSFKNNTFWWEDAKQNWPAVCISGIIATYLYMASDEEIAEVLPRMTKCLDNYLLGYDDEGCCQEGYAYWCYGFGAFCEAAEFLHSYSNGKIDYFSIPKVKAIAKFQQNVTVNDRQYISFSDAGSDFNPECGLSHFLKNKYSEVEIPEIPGDRDKMCNLVKLLWMDHRLEKSEMHPKSHIFHANQWFIYRSDDYNFVCKAGSNREAHNHNDVGSFIISKNGKVSFTDPGSSEYTLQYFNEMRYTNFAPSARGHSLPVINGRYEVSGGQKSVVYKESETEYSFSMENAYPEGLVKKLTRSFTCGKTLTLNDYFLFEETPDSITERFITLVEPVLEKGRISCANSVLVYDADKFDAELSYEDIVRSRTKTDRAYIIDLKLKKTEREFNLTFTFE